ncbi:MAG TPA: sigma factor-like helix-turn-helix DNA-binding protein, partial [Kofleriaceae bacterium]|nr:sigma factor-like helix-turn-helix DNA-binding protein [Kofleriaceae bacterium]
LPADMRTTVILVCMQGLSHGEVAVVQNVSEGTIAWRMHEARRRMNESMAPEKLQRKRELSTELSRALGEHGFSIPVLSKSRA